MVHSAHPFFSEKSLVAPASCRCGAQAGSLCHQRRRARRPALPV